MNCLFCSATRVVFVFAILLAALFLSVSYAQRDSAEVVSASPLPEGDVTTQLLDAVGPNCRHGLTPLGSAQMSWLNYLGAGWYLNFGIGGYSEPTTAEFVPMVRLKPHKDSQGNYLPGYEVIPPLTESGLGQRVLNNPGKLWIIGNEVDRGPDPGNTVSPQDDLMPATYARAYHDVYRFIKQRDPTAQIAISALVQVTPGRLQYLDMVWDSYIQQFGSAMPVDVWNMHIYILPEVRPDGQPNGIAGVALGTDPSLGMRESNNNVANCSLTDNVYCWADHDNMAVFAQQVVAMRTWMKQRGQQHKPLILSEYSQLYPFTDYDDPDNPTVCFLMDEYGRCWTERRVADFLTASINYLESARDPNLGYPLDDYQLVQQWLWFSISTSRVGHASNLVTADLASLTQVGQRYKAEVEARTAGKKPNLFPSQTLGGVGFISPPDSTTSVTISTKIRNNGDISVISPFLVTFYRDAALQNPIGSVTVNGLPGCARHEVIASTVWSDLGPGVHRFWVKVDSQNGIPEENELDNVGSGFAIINPEQIFLPIIRR